MIVFRVTDYGDIKDNSGEYVAIGKSGKDAVLDGEFTYDHLQSILDKMKELQERTSRDYS